MGSITDRISSYRTSLFARQFQKYTMLKVKPSRVTPIINTRIPRVKQVVRNLCTSICKYRDCFQKNTTFKEIILSNLQINLIEKKFCLKFYLQASKQLKWPQLVFKVS